MDTRARIETVLRDITDMAVDAIVNEANANLTLGVRVAGTIKKKGGHSIQKECDMIGPIPRGQAAVTRAGKLKLKYVIHAAGMHLGGKVSKMSLRDATLISLNRADEKGVKSIAFPAIGTGV